MADKKYTFRITAEVVGDDGLKMFDAHVNYENMGYDDVCLVEGAIIKMFDSLNQYAVARVTPSKPAVPVKR
jgi:hypothetical protein